MTPADTVKLAKVAGFTPKDVVTFIEADTAVTHEDVSKLMKALEANAKRATEKEKGMTMKRNKTYAQIMDSDYPIRDKPTYDTYQITGDQALDNLANQALQLGRVLDGALLFAVSLGPIPKHDLRKADLCVALESLGPATKIEILDRLLHAHIGDSKFWERVGWTLGYATRGLKAASEALSEMLLSAPDCPELMLARNRGDCSGSSPDWPALVFHRADILGCAANLLDEDLTCEPATKGRYGKFSAMAPHGRIRDEADHDATPCKAVAPAPQPGRNIPDLHTGLRRLTATPKEGQP